MKTEELKPQPYSYYSNTEEYFNKVKWSGFKISELSVNVPQGMEIFINQYHNLLLKFQNEIFVSLMRIEWSDRKIHYAGKNIHSYPGNPGQFFNTSLKFFYEHYLGFTRLFWSDGMYPLLRSYADDLFPGFGERDGFVDPFTYPYQYLPLEALCLVARLEYRLELLAEGERMHLTLPKFCDYVAAYCTDIKVKTGRDLQIYNLVWNRKTVPYVNEKLSFIERMKRKELKKKEKGL